MLNCVDSSDVESNPFAQGSVNRSRSRMKAQVKLAVQMIPSAVELGSVGLVLSETRPL